MMKKREGLPHRDLIAFCETQYPRLVGLVALYCGDALLAEEIAQEALARACRDWKKVRSMDRPEAYVYRIAINLAHSFFRKRAAELRARRHLESDAARPPLETADSELLDSVRRLPAKPRAVILLRYYLGMSVRETADALGVPEGTIKTLTRRGISRLRADELPKEAARGI